jgi:hypothetical protein
VSSAAGGQLALPVGAEGGRRQLTVLDQRARGTRFLSLTPRSVLNSPARTGMGFWSVNPYVGCEFGCTYCYARDTHRYAMERSGAALEPMPAWEAFERRILVKTGVAEVLARTLDPARLGGHSLDRRRPRMITPLRQTVHETVRRFAAGGLKPHGPFGERSGWCASVLGLNASGRWRFWDRG